MDSLGFPWTHLGSLGLTWTHLVSLVSFGFTWTQLHSLGFTWTHLDSLGVIWIHLDSCGFTWIHLDSLGFTSLPAFSPSLSQGKRENLSGRKGKGKEASHHFRLIPTRPPDRAHVRTHARHDTKRFPGWTKPPNLRFRSLVATIRKRILVGLA